jgi:hypothetical protein
MKRLRISGFPSGAARLAGFALMIFALTACDTMLDIMDVNRKPPDEYAVSTGQPLVTPPDYELRAPGASEAGSQGVEEQSLATYAAEAGLSAGEVALLREAGARRTAGQVPTSVPTADYDRETERFFEEVGAEKTY